MKTSLPSRAARVRMFLTATLVFSLFVWAGCDDGALTEPGAGSSAATAGANAGPPSGVNPPGLEHAMRVQDRNTLRLMKKPGIVGTATAISKAGEPTIVVYAKTKAKGKAAGIPNRLEKVPVKVRVTGLFMARADETTRQRPVPVGFSMGHPDITAGTFGARVRDGAGNVYALSNNHVLADVNEASIGDNTLQPGPFDGGTNPEDAIGTLSDFEPIDFSGNNTIDAAITSSSTANLDFSTSSEGYGTPSSTPFTLDSDGDGNTDGGVVGLAVQKYGRTTGLTQGEVAEVNVTVSVCYESSGFFGCSKSATFVDQLSITPGTFSDGGDSGSLIVTDDGTNRPVGLLFAGSDTRTLANPIDAVLSRFGITIDDGSGDGGGGGTNTAPSAGFSVTTSDLTADFTDTSSDPDGSVNAWSWDFGDGATATAQNPSHTYASEGTYTVSLTVTDDDGATDTATQDVTVSSASGGGFTLSVSGRRVRGRHTNDLSWSGATTSDVDIYLDGSILVTTANDGAYTHRTDNRGKGSYTYQVCEAGTSTCSNEATVTY